MKINMDDSRLTNINQIKDFLKGSKQMGLSLVDEGIKKKYTFFEKTIKRFNYFHLNKKGKRVILSYIKKITGYKKAQLYRLLKRVKAGHLARKSYQRINPAKIYTSRDIKLLEETDELHLKLNALATKEILRREVEIFGNSKYQTIARVSRSHLNNLRKSSIYKSHWSNPTKPRIVPIGSTQPPEHHGRPGSIRIDTVHQRDVYHINAVDEITQWEVVVCVPTISEQFIKVAIELIIDQCPFVIFNFHSDRGGEYINYIVARLLTKLLINQTKSRSRHPNDNALVETKNGSVIRKRMGWEHLDQGASDLINQYYQKYFNPYLNYHRPCLFSTGTKTNPHGREYKLYNQATTPYEKLKEVTTSKKTNFFKKGITIKSLDKIAYQHSDNEFAKILQEEERKLFEKINKLNQISGSRRKPKV